MPELPEVETIRRHLAPHVEGRTLERLEILDPRWSRPLAPARARRRGRGPRGRAARPPRQVPGLGARGRGLPARAPADDRHAAARPATSPPHTRVWFELGDHRLAFTDPRRFGTGELALGRGRAGRVPRRPARRRAARRRTSPPSTCTRSRAARARRSRRSCSTRSASPASATSTPTRRCSARASTRCGPRTGSPRAQCAALRDAVVASLEAGIAAKGATIDDFRDPYGVSGTFQDQFLVHLREGEPCPNCGAPGAQAARRRARDLRVRALPAAAAG